MSNNLEPPIPLLADAAVAAARAAGAVLLEEFGNERHIEYKGIIDLVTDADRRSEQTVVSMLREHFPDHQILAEEGTSGGTSPRYRWIIDPLDGTTNYAHRYPHFAVSIGLERGGEMLIGVVYDPVLDELFTAQAGSGAFLNGRQLRVSRSEPLQRSLLCTGFPYDHSFLKASLRRWDQLVRDAQAVRRDGSAALDICYVAAGRFDGFWEDHLFPWDMAAGMLIAREAGGSVTDYQGLPPSVYRGELVVSNGLIHEAMLTSIAAADGTS
ncbi:MAG: inositol monophosphatase [Actinobacteria bacterium]|nr:inositol monophosphatase [Actinomycetota bacterium]